MYKEIRLLRPYLCFEYNSNDCCDQLKHEDDGDSPAKLQRKKKEKRNDRYVRRLYV